MACYNVYTWVCFWRKCRCIKRRSRKCKFAKNHIIHVSFRLYSKFIMDSVFYNPKKFQMPLLAISISLIFYCPSFFISSKIISYFCTPIKFQTIKFEGKNLLMVLQKMKENKLVREKNEKKWVKAYRRIQTYPYILRRRIQLLTYTTLTFFLCLSSISIAKLFTS